MDRQVLIVLPDEQLNYWARTYHALRARGQLQRVSFERFLQVTPQVRASGSLTVIELRARVDHRFRSRRRSRRCCARRSPTRRAWSRAVACSRSSAIEPGRGGRAA
jgi:hypothetical protein